MKWEDYDRPKADKHLRNSYAIVAISSQNNVVIFRVQDQPLPSNLAWRKMALLFITEKMDTALAISQQAVAILERRVADLESENARLKIKKKKNKWISSDGTVPPVEARTKIKVKLRNGMRDEFWHPARIYTWQQTGIGTDIIAYKIKKGQS